MPVAGASSLSHSLRSVLKTGLLVRYTVSERVTGRFEVLLGSSVARRLHLRGTAATGLPAGMAAQTVIGKAILVTQTGGRHTVRIVFSKSIASRLSGVHNITFMLRIGVRNAAGGSTSVLTPVKLKR